MIDEFILYYDNYVSSTYAYYMYYVKKSIHLLYNTYYQIYWDNDNYIDNQIFNIFDNFLHYIFTTSATDEYDGGIPTMEQIAIVIRKILNIDKSLPNWFDQIIQWKSQNQFRPPIVEPFKLPYPENIYSQYLNIDNINNYQYSHNAVDMNIDMPESTPIVPTNMDLTFNNNVNVNSIDIPISSNPENKSYKYQANIGYNIGEYLLYYPVERNTEMSARNGVKCVVIKVSNDFQNYHIQFMDNNIERDVNIKQLSAYSLNLGDEVYHIKVNEKALYKIIKVYNNFLYKIECIDLKNCPKNALLDYVQITLLNPKNKYLYLYDPVIQKQTISENQLEKPKNIKDFSKSKDYGIGYNIGNYVYYYKEERKYPEINNIYAKCLVINVSDDFQNYHLKNENGEFYLDVNLNHISPFDLQPRNEIFYLGNPKILFKVSEKQDNPTNNYYNIECNNPKECSFDIKNKIIKAHISHIDPITIKMNPIFNPFHKVYIPPENRSMYETPIVTNTSYTIRPSSGYNIGTEVLYYPGGISEDTVARNGELYTVINISTNHQAYHIKDQYNHIITNVSIRDLSPYKLNIDDIVYTRNVYDRLYKVIKINDNNKYDISCIENCVLDDNTSDQIIYNNIDISQLYGIYNKQHSQLYYKYKKPEITLYDPIPELTKSSRYTNDIGYNINDQVLYYPAGRNDETLSSRGTKVKIIKVSIDYKNYHIEDIYKNIIQNVNIIDLSPYALNVGDNIYHIMYSGLFKIIKKNTDNTYDISCVDNCDENTEYNNQDIAMFNLKRKIKTLDNPEIKQEYIRKEDIKGSLSRPLPQPKYYKQSKEGIGYNINQNVLFYPSGRNEETFARTGIKCKVINFSIDYQMYHLKDEYGNIRTNVYIGDISPYSLIKDDKVYHLEYDGLFKVIKKNSEFYYEIQCIDNCTEQNEIYSDVNIAKLDFKNNLVPKLELIKPEKFNSLIFYEKLIDLSVYKPNTISATTPYIYFKNGRNENTSINDAIFVHINTINKEAKTVDITAKAGSGGESFKNIPLSHISQSLLSSSTLSRIFVIHTQYRGIFKVIRKSEKNESRNYDIQCVYDCDNKDIIKDVFIGHLTTVNIDKDMLEKLKTNPIYNPNEVTQNLEQVPALEPAPGAEPAVAPASAVVQAPAPEAAPVQGTAPAQGTAVAPASAVVQAPAQGAAPVVASPAQGAAPVVAKTPAPGVASAQGAAQAPALVPVQKPELGEVFSPLLSSEPEFQQTTDRFSSAANMSRGIGTKKRFRRGYNNIE